MAVLGQSGVHEADWPRQVGRRTSTSPVRAVGKDKTAIRETASWAEVVLLAVPFAAIDDVVKAFNTVFAQHMDSGRLGDNPLTAFVAGDDAGAKSGVLEFAREIGFKLFHG